MSQTFDNAKAEEYKETLEPYYKKIIAKLPLTANEYNEATKISLEYYNFIADSGIAYGNAARDVITNNNSYGKFANAHLKREALLQGTLKTDLPYVINNIKVSLAYRDVELRAAQDVANGNIELSKVANYHYNIFEEQGLTKLAWGGAAFEEFAGSGSWMSFGGYDQNIEVCYSCLAEALVSDSASGGMSARASVNSLFITSIHNPTVSTGILLTKTAELVGHDVIDNYARIYDAHNYIGLFGNKKNFVNQGTITPEGEVIMDAPQARYQDFTSGDYPDSWQGLINEQADYGSKSKSEFSDVELLNSFVAPDFSNPVTYINSVLGNNAFWNSEIAGHRLEENLKFIKELRSKYDGWNTLKEADFQFIPKQESSDYSYRFDFDYSNIRSYEVPSRSSYEWKPPAQSGSGWQYHGGAGFHHMRYTNNDNFEMNIGVYYPVIIDIKGKGLKLLPYSKSHVFYDLDDDGYIENTGWVGSENSILAYDANRDGIISGGKEISFKVWSPDAKTDMEGLKLAFDSNKNDLLDKGDANYQYFYLWNDANQDGVCQKHELTSLKDSGIISISLSTKPSDQKNVLGTSSINWDNENSGKAYDIYFEHSIAGIKVVGDSNNIEINYQKGGNDKIYISTKEKGEKLDLQATNIKVAIGSKGNDHFYSTGDYGVILDGGAGDDVLEVEQGNNWLKGGPGSDTLKGGRGHDILFIDSEDKQENIDGGQGYDVAIVANKNAVKLDLAKSNIEAAIGNKGRDTFDASASKQGVYIDGGWGDDILLGSPHDDILIGGKGRDKIFAGDGDDSVFIDSEDNLEDIDCGNGEDKIFIHDKKGVKLDLGKVNAEIAFGGTGDDHLFYNGDKKVILVGGKGNDILEGGKGDDLLDGGTGDDRLCGGAGKDRYLFGRNSGKDIIDCKNPNDLKDDLVLLNSNIKLEELSFEKQGDDLLFKVKNTESSLRIPNWFKGNKLDSFIYRADTGTPNTIILLENKDNELMLNNEKSRIVFAFDGADIIGGGNHNDLLSGGKGKDAIKGFEGDDIIFGGDGDDELMACESSNIKDINKGKNCGNNKIFGEGGNDFILGDAGNDLLDGGPGDDLIYTGLGKDVVYTGSGNDGVWAKGGTKVIHIDGPGVKEIHLSGKSNRIVLYPSKHENVFAVALDFDIKDASSKLDFSKFDHIKSRDDLIFDWGNVATEGAAEKSRAASFCDEKLGVYNCIYLVGHEGKEFPDDMFIFAEAN